MELLCDQKGHGGWAAHQDRRREGRMPVIQTPATVPSRFLHISPNRPIRKESRPFARRGHGSLVDSIPASPVPFASPSLSRPEEQTSPMPVFPLFAVLVEVFPGDADFFGVEQFMGTDLDFWVRQLLVENRRLKGAVRHSDQFCGLSHIGKLHCHCLHIW